ncbi:MAG TPA: hypothetical protein VFM88_07715 [Vicinamibacteria bacterium]|nr:hypothetical protein [Vicinamibacteria bacterium]
MDTFKKAWGARLEACGYSVKKERDMTRFRSGVTLLAVLALAGSAFAQTAAKPASDEAATDAAIEQLRKDARADINTIITASMRFTGDEAAKFWPLYKNFEQQRKAIGDEKLALIKAYATSYNAGPVTDSRAQELMVKAIGIEEKSLAAKKQFMQELQKALPGKTVARFFMVQNRIDLLTALELAEGIPLID